MSGTGVDVDPAAGAKGVASISVNTEGLASIDSEVAVDTEGTTKAAFDVDGNDIEEVKLYDACVELEVVTVVVVEGIASVEAVASFEAVAEVEAVASIEAVAVVEGVAAAEAMEAVEAITSVEALITEDEG